MKRLKQQLKESYDGDPWFGKSIKSILSEIDVEEAFIKPKEQHSILELLYHMIIWREFTMSRMKPEAGKNSVYFEKNDWEDLDHTDKSLWTKGLQRLEYSQMQLIDLIGHFKKERLDDIVPERDYDFNFLLNGIIQHDIYHLGQIAYVKKIIG
ncbi:MAG: DinB family protein [Saprospiraceae bacterium]